MHRWRAGWPRRCRSSTTSSPATPSPPSRTSSACWPGDVMRDLLDDIDRWRADGHRVAVARVVGVDGSGPRDPGAAMAVSDSGEVAGSVSGGCVEGAVVTEALAVLSGER